MRSPASAIAWEFRQRHRWGLIALAVYLLVLATLRLLNVGAQQLDLEDEQSLALVVVVPLTATFIYFLAVFSFGLDGDLAARQSMYPARMFTMPVTSAALAAWPMLYGSAAVAILWIATRLLAIWPPNATVPTVWPALLAASLLAWTQALTWMPYALPGLRVIVTVLWLAAIDAVVLLALRYEAREQVMLAILAPHVPIAYLVARSAVARARRGDVPDWRRIFSPLGKIADVLPQRLDRFPSPARAQTWFEWRQHGRSLPALIAILLPFELAMFFIFRDTPAIVVEIFFGVLLTPPFMAVFVGATVSKSNSGASDSYGVTPFIATRPLTNASLISSKLKATIVSTLAAWLLILVFLPLAMRLSGTSPVLIEGAHRLVEVLGMARAVPLVLLGLVALMASTWKQLVQSLYAGMSGREWVVKSSVFLALSFLAVIFPLAHWVARNRYVIAVLWNALPWIAAVLVCLKIFVAAWIAVRLRDGRLLSDRSLVIGALCWDAGVFAFYAVLVWIVPEIIVRHYVLALVAILEVPLVRLSAAPLALAWNRHR
jgi:hypothetical protein